VTIINPGQRSSVSRILLRAASQRRDEQSVRIADLLADLGDRSFAWSVLIFAMLNVIPLPPGATLILAIPVLLVTGQMALGFTHLSLPDFIARRRVSRDGLRRGVLRMRPLLRAFERMLRPRKVWMFTRRTEQLTAMCLFAVAVALYIPLPGSGFLPALSLMVAALAMLERDGLVMMIGLGMGAVSITITLAVIAVLLAGLQLIT
jgi:hypothetical protein